MISIKDGKLYQWDTGRIVMCKAPEGMQIDEIHLDNYTTKNAIILKTYLEGDYVCAKIPDVVLQKLNPINIYTVMRVENDEKTIESSQFNVIQRKKPEDYVYEEEEILRYSKLEEQINALNEKVDNLDVPEVEVDDSLSKESINPVQNKVVTEAVKGLEKKIDDIEIPEFPQTDLELSETSTNPIQNKAVTEAINTVKEKVEDVDLSKKFTAVPGQVVRVKAVDEKGNPTEWEATDITTGEENVQSDLSENDENSAAYVKNRTHWVEEKIVLSETNVVRGQNGVEFSYVIEEGKTYTIKFNGEIYNCKAKSSEIPETLTIGNASLMIGEDTGEPFCIGATIGDTEGGMVFNNLFEDTTVSIVLEEYHPLSPKFLPNGGVTRWDDLTDKPFYSEYEEAEILPETTVELNPDDVGMAPINKLGLVAGLTYTVIWNGTEAEYICKEMIAEGLLIGVGLGNVEAMGGTGDSGDTFAIVDFTTEGQAILGVEAAVIDLTGATSATFSITGMIETVHPLEEKYLPKLRGQKKIVLNISEMTTSVLLDEALQMDLAELKSSIVITDGTNEVYDVVSINKNTVVYNDVTYAMLKLTVLPKQQDKYIGFRVIQWNTQTGFDWYSDETATIPVDMFNPQEKNMLLGICYESKKGYGTRWLPFTKIGFDNIVLKSTDSYKYFRITVNDSGTITATEVIDEQIL